MPQVNEVGLAQLVMMLPRARPGGTRSDAMAPAIVPRKNGVMTEENANAAPNRRRCQSSGDGFAERERRPAGDDADRDQGERDVEGGSDGREQWRERGPDDDEDEDQPDVVGLPDRPDRVLDECAAGPTVLRVAGNQVPEPGAEVGPAQQGVGSHR